MTVAETEVIVTVVVVPYMRHLHPSNGLTLQWRRHNGTEQSEMCAVLEHKQRAVGGRKEGRSWHGEGFTSFPF